MSATGGSADRSLPPLVDPVPELSAEERARYSRHLLLGAIGDEGQRRLVALV